MRNTKVRYKVSIPEVAKHKEMLPEGYAQSRQGNDG